MIALETPHDYELVLSDDGSYALAAGGRRCTFRAPSSTRGMAKLYTVAAEGAFHYVGIAERPMASRIGNGLRASGKGGYHGYKWKTLRHALHLSVWTAKSGSAAASRREMETVEAEVAFLCRHLSGQWPTFQHEIHFYPSGKDHREAAASIYAHTMKRTF